MTMRRRLTAVAAVSLVLLLLFFGSRQIQHWQDETMRKWILGVWRADDEDSYFNENGTVTVAPGTISLEIYWRVRSGQLILESNQPDIWGEGARYRLIRVDKDTAELVGLIDEWVAITTPWFEVPLFMREVPSGTTLRMVRSSKSAE